MISRFNFVEIEDSTLVNASHFKFHDFKISDASIASLQTSHFLPPTSQLLTPHSQLHTPPHIDIQNLPLHQQRIFVLDVAVQHVQVVVLLLQ